MRSLEIDRLLELSNGDPLMRSGRAARKAELAEEMCGLSTQAASTRTEMQQVEKRGVFRGATLESGRFDFRTDEGDILSGWIADTVTEDAANQMSTLTNRPAVAALQEITFITPEGQRRGRWELLGLTTIISLTSPK